VCNKLHEQYSNKLIKQVYIENVSVFSIFRLIKNIIMVRKLRFHERKLLKKVDFINWEVDHNLHEVTVMRKFHIQKREDYTKYNDLSRRVRDLARKIKELDANDPFRIEATRTLLEKLYE
jgi:hypothetical protein